MKKLVRILTCAALAAMMVLGVAACGEKEDNGPKTLRSAVAIGLVHGDGYVGEATVVVDRDGNAVKVHMDEIFLPNTAGQATKDAYDADNTNYIQAGTAGKETYYHKYLLIDGKYFEAIVSDTGVVSYKGLTDTSITDLQAYVKTNVKWYYDAFMNAKCLYAVESSEVDGTPAGDKYLASAKTNFTTPYGSMRKRYSTYWTVKGGGKISQFSGLGWEGNMDAIETYLMTYGFDNFDKLTTPSGDNKYNMINGVSTGATLSKDMGGYLKVAKDAYDAAMAK